MPDPNRSLACEDDLGYGQATVDTLEDILNEAVQSIRELETRLRTLEQRATVVADDIATMRTRLIRERTEREIIYSIENPGCEPPLMPSNPLQEQEYSLSTQLQHAERITRSISDFIGVIHLAARRIEAAEPLPSSEEHDLISSKQGAIHAREDERRRIARDIHDGPAQALANSILAIELIDRTIRNSGVDTGSKIDEELKAVKWSMREGLTEIRRLIFDSRPAALEDRGIFETIRMYVEQYQSIFPIRVTVDVPDDMPRLRGDLELAAFRILLEAIQNAFRHSHASRIAIEASHQDDDLVVVMIRDDGRGFDLSRTEHHALGGAGLGMMRERAELAGIDLLIDSEPGVGTCVKIVMSTGKSGAFRVGQ